MKLQKMQLSVTRLTHHWCTWQLCLCLHNIHRVYWLYFSLCINNYFSVVHNQAWIFNKAWDYPPSHAVSHSAFLTVYLTFELPGEASGIHQKSGEGDGLVTRLA